jgi:hypothetical protein
MPVARIYASLVEESEPLCADLLARGYNVEVVFPDAMLPTVADLELRVERCSAEQAIARVEAGGSPSRCVCVTPGMGPRRELLMVEMTVPSTGTRGRHPMTMPATAFMGHEAVSILTKPIDFTPENAAPATLLSFPVLAQEPLLADTLPQNGSASGHDVHNCSKEQTPLSHRENGETFGKNEIAELNSFLAHAPGIERPEMLATKLLENLCQWRGFERVRNRWQVLSLLAGACSFFLLLAIGWFAATSHSRIAGMLPETPASTKAAGPKLATPRVASQYLRGRRALAVGDGLIAQDTIVRVDGSLASKPHPQPSATSLIKPAAIQPPTIKRISDLK